MGKFSYASGKGHLFDFSPAIKCLIISSYDQGGIKPSTSHDWNKPSSFYSSQTFTTHVISPISEKYLPIFEKISLFGMSELLNISCTFLYLEFKVSRLNIKNFFLCLIIHSVW